MSLRELTNFQDKQQEAINTLLSEACKYLLYGGAGGGGKSYFLRWAAVVLGVYYTQKYGIENVPIGLFSEDYPTLKDRQISKISVEFPSWLGVLKESKMYGLAFHSYPQWGKWIILLRNLDDPSKYASTEFAAILVEELTKSQEQAFHDLRFRLRFPGVPDPKFAAATNPGSRGHGWVKRRWVKPDPLLEDPEKDKFFYIPAKVDDNKYIDKNYKVQLEGLPPKMRAALLEGSWDQFEGQVFEEFNQKKHVVKNMLPNPRYTHYLCMDWGYSENSAFAAYAFAIIPKQHEDEDGVKTNYNRIIVYQEWYGNKKTPEHWAELIFQTARNRDFEACYVDPAMLNARDDGSTPIAHLMRNRMEELNGDQHWVTFKRANHDRPLRVATYHNWLADCPDGLPYMVFTQNCRNIIRTLPDLVYDEKKPDDLDTKQEDHAYDALGYGIVHMKYIAVAPGTFGKKRGTRKKVLPAAFEGEHQIDPTEFEEAKPNKRDWVHV